jgi:MtN3 and saliva related transmembrane protein
LTMPGPGLSSSSLRRCLVTGLHHLYSRFFRHSFIAIGTRSTFTGSRYASSMPDIIGWISSCILLVTISQQVYKQFRDGTSRGVSKWLFIGELASALGFLIYIVTNSVMVLNAIAGLAITLHHRRREES